MLYLYYHFFFLQNSLENFYNLKRFTSKIYSRLLNKQSYKSNLENSVVFLLGNKDTEEIAYNKNLLETTQLKTENNQLQIENAALRNRILALNSEVYGAKLAAKYLDKELAGRIQQLQLLGDRIF